MPILAVTQALPGAGKTTLASFLQQELGFVRLDVSNDLQRRFGKNWWKRVQRRDGFWWMDVYDRNVFRPAARELAGGRDVLVDTITGATIWAENHCRLENLFLRHPEAKQYLIEINARPRVRHRRIAEREGIPLAKARRRDENYNWRRRWQPDGRPITVLCYRNNTPEDFALMAADLSRRFSRSGGKKGYA